MRTRKISSSNKCSNFSAAPSRLAALISARIHALRPQLRKNKRPTAAAANSSSDQQQQQPTSVNITNTETQKRVYCTLDNGTHFMTSL